MLLWETWKKEYVDRQGVINNENSDIFCISPETHTQKFPHLFHWGADPTEHIPFQNQQVQRM